MRVGFSPNESFSVDEDSTNQQTANLPDFQVKSQFQVPGVIVQIVCGQSHIVALSSDGNLFSFGSNQFGQRGSATQQVNLPKIRSIAAGIYHTMALSVEDKLYSWGRGTEGQLGLNNFECYEDPQEALTQVEKIYCGGFHTVIIKKDQKIFVTGDNTHGQLGIENSQNCVNKFTMIALPHPVSEVSTGLEHTLFLTTTKEVYACGNNLFGQCGIENLQQTKKPIKLNLATPIVKIYASTGTFSAALNDKYQILLWGTGSWGYARKPTVLNELCSNLPKAPVKDLMIGDNYAVIAFQEGELLMLGSNSLPDLEGETKNILEPLSIPSGEKLICGQKLIITLKYENDLIPIEPKKLKKNCPAPKSIRSIEYSKNESHQQKFPSYSNTSSQKSLQSPSTCNCKEIQNQNQNLQQSLKSAQEEKDKIKKDLDYTNNLLKQKEEQITILTSRLLQAESECQKRKQSFVKLEESLLLPSDPLEKREQVPVHKSDTKNRQTEDTQDSKEFFFQNRMESRQAPVQKDDDIFRSIVQQKRVQQMQQPEKTNIIEESFALSRYNFKTIRSITPMDMRQSDLINNSILDQTNQQPQQVLANQGLNDSTSKIKKEFDRNNIKYYTRGQLSGQTAQNPCSNQLPPKVQERTFEYKNYTNTSIIDKIQNFQKTVESAATVNRKHYRVSSSGNELYQQEFGQMIVRQNEASAVKAPQLQYRFSVCEESEQMPKSYYKPYEDYYRLRG